MERLGEDKKALELALEELEKYRRDREVLRLRNACEKGWLAVVLVTDHLITCAGVERAHGRAERAELLEELEERVDEVKRLGISDRMWARSQDFTQRGSVRVG